MVLDAGGSINGRSAFVSALSVLPRACNSTASHRLRLPLSLGVRVVAAHVASTGRYGGERSTDRLARWAFVGGTVQADETIATFGQKVLAASAGLGTREPKDVVSSDMKVYSSGGYHFAIAQAEVSDLYEVDERLPALKKALEQLRDSNGLNFTMLMVTDVVRGSSRLLLTDSSPAILEELPYPPMQDGTRLAEGVVSRKKQLLPGILGLLEM